MATLAMPKPTKEESSDGGSTDEEMALVMRNFKKFMKKKFHKKKPNHRRCYECKELGHYIADCPKLKNKENERRSTRRRARTS